jgi:hypothetical protein
MTTELSWLSVNLSKNLFGEGTGHVPVPLVRLKDAKMLWVNYQVSAQDPNFEKCGRNRERYEAYLLEACAYRIAIGDEVSADSSDLLMGYADRYGGYGIGANGGSGRAVILEEYSIKGCGRTPLVSATTDASHASGGAYLEEIVRETIYSEIVRAEFPFSAIPTLAIIDTGLVQIWDDEGGKAERRVLMVRPNFIRPAHYIRANFFLSNNHLEGAEDFFRVGRFFENSIEKFGKNKTVNFFLRFWFRWAEQLAYSFIHRLPHGSNTLSNVALDGRLLDFGATSAVSSWANIATMRAFQPFGSQAELLENLIASFFYFLSRHLDPIFSDKARLNNYILAVRSKYFEIIVKEFLVVCGLSRSRAIELVANGAYDKIIQPIVLPVIGYYQQEKADFIEGETQLNREWDLYKLWSNSVPMHLKDLKKFLSVIVSREERSIAQKRCLQLSSVRRGFCHSDIKKEIFKEIDFSWQRQPPKRKIVEDCITRMVARGRLDTHADIADGFIIGFAVSSNCTYVLWKRRDNSSVLAVKEFSKNESFLVKRICAERIEFDSKEIEDFIGAVVLYSDWNDFSAKEFE